MNNSTNSDPGRYFAFAFPGFFLGGFLGFLLRPANMFVGKLPFETVITLGSNLKGLDSLLKGLAQTSFLIMLGGAIVGAVIGAIIAHFSLKNKETFPKKTYSDRSYSESDSFYSRDSYASSPRGMDRETAAVIEGYSLKIQNDPLNIDLLYEFAEFLTNKGHHDKSIETLLKLITIEKNNLRSLKLLMLNYESCERYEDFTNTAEKIIALESSDKNTLMKLSNILFQQRKFDDSLLYIDSLLKLDSKNKDAWLLKSRVFESIDKVDQAITSLYQAIKLDPSDVKNKLKLVELLSENKECEKIISVLKSIRTYKSNQDKLISSLYMIWCLLNIDEKSDELNKLSNQLELADIERANFNNGEIKAKIYSFLASKRFLQNDFESALSLYQKAKASHAFENINQNIASTYNEIGKKHLNNAKYSEAFRSFNEGALFDRNNEELNTNLSLVSRKLKKRKVRLGASFAAAAITVLACISIYYYGRQSFNITVHNSALIKVMKGDNTIATRQGTNLKTSFLFYGDYRIIAENEGYETTDFIEKAGFGRNSKDIKFSLKPQYGILKIDSEPSNAKVIIKNIYQKKESRTPCEFSGIFALETEIEVALKGYNSYIVKKEIIKDKTTDLGKIAFTGGLIIDSNPSGVEVLIDDKPAGVTPLKIDSISAKRIKVFARKKNWGAYLSDIDIKPGEITDLGKVTLSKVGFLRLNSTPIGARVWLDKREIGKTPIVLENIAIGNHNLKVAYTDLVPFEKTLRFKPGEAIDLGTISFIGSIKMATEPAGAEVYINGKKRGKTPIIINDLPSKKTNVELRVAGKGSYVSDVYVKPGVTTDLGMIKIRSWMNKLLRYDGKWKTEIQISSLDEGKKSGKINFRSLKCGGDLIYVGSSDKGFLFNEKLTYGRCVKGCQILLSSDGRWFKEICKNKITGSGNLKLSLGSIFFKEDFNQYDQGEAVTKWGKDLIVKKDSTGNKYLTSEVPGTHMVSQNVEFPENFQFEYNWSYYDDRNSGRVAPHVRVPFELIDDDGNIFRVECGNWGAKLPGTKIVDFSEGSMNRFRLEKNWNNYELYNNGRLLLSGTYNNYSRFVSFRFIIPVKSSGNGQKFSDFVGTSLVE